MELPFNKQISEKTNVVSAYLDFEQSALRLYIPNGAPTYEPDLWNKYSSKYNCYSYALRLRGHGWGNPGHIESFQKKFWSAKELKRKYIRKKLIQDKLEEIDFNQVAITDHVIVAFVRPKMDFHFYSLDQDGFWSHKDSDKPVEKIYDFIENPEKDLTINNHCKKFVGLFKVPNSGLQYSHRLNLD